jgi:hypothetical protein
MGHTVWAGSHDFYQDPSAYSILYVHYQYNFGSGNSPSNRTTGGFRLFSWNQATVAKFEGSLTAPVCTSPFGNYSIESISAPPLDQSGNTPHALSAYSAIFFYKQLYKSVFHTRAQSINNNFWANNHSYPVGTSWSLEEITSELGYLR